MYILFGLLAIYLLILPFGVKKANRYINGMLDNFWWVVFAAFVLAVAVSMAGYSDGVLYDQCIQLDAAILMGSPILIIRNVLRKKKKANKTEYNRQESVVPDLPDRADARMKIVRKFNKKFDLSLREEEIEKIVNGSFHSEEWAREIAAMKERYSTESEWYSGETAWLRAYLRAFNVQNVSSDFKLQREMCLDNLNDIFASTDFSTFYSIDACIEYINNRYMTNFNDISFMIAYRFLEKNGKKYKLPSTDIVEATSEIDRLAEKYDESVVKEEKKNARQIT